jgi:hypothetical protein
MLSKQDRAAQWHALFEEQRSSGLSVTEWCRRRGIEKNTFYGWRKRLAETPVFAASSPPQFMAVAIASDPPVVSTGLLTLRVGQFSLDIASGFDRRLLADVLSVLTSQC